MAVDTIRMDLLVSLMLGVVVVVILAGWIMSAVGIGERFLDPFVAVVVAPAIWVSRNINARRRKRSIARLPSDVPPPPAGP